MSAEELLEKIEAEIKAEVEKEALLADNEIKIRAQEAYDECVRCCLEEIRKHVEEKYAIAKSYLIELLPKVEAVSNEAPDYCEACSVEEHASEEAYSAEPVIADVDNSTEVI